jgi:hypothetical protein
MRAVVLFESLTGHTRQAAELIGGAVRDAGVDVSVYPITSFDFRELADADLVFVGSWTDGFVFFGQRPGRAARIWRLPALDHKAVAIFCTYAVNPRTTLPKLQSIMEAKGTRVVAARAFKRNRLEEGVADFVGEALSAVRTEA